MSQGKVRALKCDVADVGKHIKSSKKRYFWSLSIGQRFYHFVLDSSLVSGKSKLAINGKVFHQVQENTLSRALYDHTFIIDGCQFNISQIENGFEMRVNNKTFSHMLAQEMSSIEFKEHSVEQNSFQLAGKLKQGDGAKKITLNLPGMGNAMKKKKGPVAQSDNWGQFAGSPGFPNFFGQTEKECKPIAPKVEVQPEPVKAQCQPVTEQVKEQVKIPSADDFSTLQNLFKTITACGEYTPKTTTETVSTPTYDLNEIPALPQINLEEFNTMQNLFSTINNQSTFFKQEEKPEESPKTVPGAFSTIQQAVEVKSQQANESVKPKMEDFNTMQNLFSTLKQPTPINTPQTVPAISQPAIDLTKVNINDFNTLQNLFATGFPLPTSISTSNPQAKITPEQQFHTIKSSFATNSQNKSTEPIPDLSKINLNDFNTIQNLFSTNTFAPTNKEVLGLTDKANKTEQSKSISTKKESTPTAADFNTMQNLFATKGGKSQNAFWQFS